MLMIAQSELHGAPWEGGVAWEVGRELNLAPEDQGS